MGYKTERHNGSAKNAARNAGSMGSSRLPILSPRVGTTEATSGGGYQVSAQVSQMLFVDHATTQQEVRKDAKYLCE